MSQKILVIEDDQYTRDVYQEILKEAGFDVATGIDGQDGFQKAKEGGYDLILLDVMMPKMDGLGVLKELKAITPKVNNGPIIMLTNLSHDPIIDEALSLGAKSYMTKVDINPDQLVANAKAFLAESKDVQV